MPKAKINSKTYLLATRSSGKLREMKELFGKIIEGANSFSSDQRVEIIDLDEAGIPEDVAEDEIECFDTFEQNAAAKAEYFYKKSGLPTFADDSGLVVHALGGQPGVRSKRWCDGEEQYGSDLDLANNRKLVELLSLIPEKAPFKAEYICAASFCDGNRTLVETGRTGGQIVLSAVGNGGFGYDPYFLSDELGTTFGAASPGEKQSVSHRQRAFFNLFERLSR